SFLRKVEEPSSNPDCHRRYWMNADYALLLLPGGFSQAGGAPDGQINTFGARQLRRFRLPPETSEVTIGFGEPSSPTDMLVVDLRQRTVRVARRGLATRLVASRDLSREWLERERDLANYLITK